MGCVDIALARDLHNRGTTITGRRCLLAAAAGRLGKSLNPVWYDRQAVQAKLQDVGRLVRGPEDWGWTYILAEQIGKLYGRCPQMFPGWFHEGLKAGGWGELGED